MNVLLASFGTHGDLRPFVALAVELRVAGHGATLDGLPDCFSLGHSFYLYYGVMPDLAPLGCLDHVDGNLILVEVDSLTDLTGLEGITEVAGSIRISSNASLLDLTGLDSLTTVGGDVDVGGTSSVAGNLEQVPSPFGVHRDRRCSGRSQVAPGAEDGARARPLRHGG